MTADLAGRRDQADGLRRLFGARAAAGTRVINVIAASAGTGRTTLVANLAACLRRSGRRVLVIDADRQAGFAENPGRMLQAADIVLVDAARRSEGCLRLPLPAVQEALLVTSAGAQAITESYAWLKSIANRHREIAFGVAVCRAGSERAARQAYANLRDVAARHLGLRIGFVGAVLQDPQLAQVSAAARLVVSSHPRSRAAVELRTLAERLDPRAPGPRAARPHAWSAPRATTGAAAA
jgi:MinD-like ATPase involved in chromosome partitioning or flagellar assembly